MKFSPSIDIVVVAILSFTGIAFVGRQSFLSSLEITNLKTSTANLKIWNSLQSDEIAKLETKLEARISNQADEITLLKTEILQAQKRNLKEIQETPFSKVGDDWYAEKRLFVFPGGVVVGKKNWECTYGEGSLSVNMFEQSYDNGNCPSGKGSVAFGMKNTASGFLSSVTGGYLNTASGSQSSVSGGKENVASMNYSTVSGGGYNVARAYYSSVSGGRQNKASNFGSSVTGGENNEASGMHSSVTGGSHNKASGDYSSVTGGTQNTASKVHSYAPESAESPFTCSKKKCTTSKKFTFNRPVTLKKSLCATVIDCNK